MVKSRAAAYDGKTNLCILCPLTNSIKGYPFEVALPGTADVTGVILCDQIKSLDWNVRNATFIEKIPEAILDDVIAHIKTLLCNIQLCIILQRKTLGEVLRGFFSVYSK
ncbi:MAG: type II toxin-antitoxin system PemK/MazF family toxin [Anaerolineaceae bacterium]|nr:type II toxin-antitoxin system PemK/MazF family toxin [Anaerolineaceae bacterium]